MLQVGNYQAVVLVRGFHPDGQPFERSAWYWINAVEKTASLTHEVVVTKQDNGEWSKNQQNWHFRHQDSHSSIKVTIALLGEYPLATYHDASCQSEGFEFSKSCDFCAFSPVLVEFSEDELYSVDLILDATLKPQGKYRVYAEIFSTEASRANPSVPAAWIGKREE